jgi:hypothetical protein
MSTLELNIGQCSLSCNGVTDEALAESSFDFFHRRKQVMGKMRC